MSLTVWPVREEHGLDELLVLESGVVRSDRDRVGSWHEAGGLGMAILLGGARSANKYLPPAPSGPDRAPERVRCPPRLSSTASGRELREFGCLRAARGDGQGPRPERACAGDVVGRVPDHPRALRRKIEAPVALGPPQGVGPELVADLAVVREGPYGEKSQRPWKPSLASAPRRRLPVRSPWTTTGCAAALAEDLGDARQDPRAALLQDRREGPPRSGRRSVATFSVVFSILNLGKICRMIQGSVRPANSMPSKDPETPKTSCRAA